MFKDVVDFIRSLYGEGFIPLHEPKFNGNEKRYLCDCIDSGYVSSVGEYVNRFERMLCEITGAKYAVATVNGTAALHMALVVAGVKSDEEVLTQALTFVATANAIRYTGAEPVFLDSGEDNLGMCPIDLERFLSEECKVADDVVFNKSTGKRIRACIPMHVFGHPAKIKEIVDICRRYKISVIEDAAESLGSYFAGQHTGTFGEVGVFSFNGNKTVTAGGGGAMIFRDAKMAERAKFLTTTAKEPHPFEFYHSEIGYNYRLPNVSAALACAQLESLEMILKDKRKTAKLYKNFFESTSYLFVDEPKECKSNFWLNSFKLNSVEERDLFLRETQEAGIMTRPVWTLMPKLPPFKEFQKTKLENAKNYEQLLINIPSSFRGQH